MECKAVYVTNTHFEYDVKDFSRKMPRYYYYDVIPYKQYKNGNLVLDPKTKFTIKYDYKNEAERKMLIRMMKKFAKIKEISKPTMKTIHFCIMNSGMYMLESGYLYPMTQYDESFTE